MLYDYVITLKRRDARIFNIMAQLLIFMSAVVAVYQAYLYPATRITFAVLIVLTIASWVYSFQRGKKNDIAYYRLPLFFSSILWLYGPNDNVYIGALLIFIGGLDASVKKAVEIGFNEENVIINTFPKNELTWSDIQNVLIKDGIITIDLNNNKLIQKEIADEVEPQLEQEFNEFCKDMLNKHRSPSKSI